MSEKITAKSIMQTAKKYAPHGPWTFTASRQNIHSQTRTSSEEEALAFLRLYVGLRWNIHIQAGDGDVSFDEFVRGLRAHQPVGPWLIKAVKIPATHDDIYGPGDSLEVTSLDSPEFRSWGIDREKRGMKLMFLGGEE